MTIITDPTPLEQDQPETQPKIKRVSKRRILVRRFFRNIPAACGFAVLVFLVLVAAFGSHFAQWSYDDPDFLNLGMGPNREHWLGTDIAGGDMFAETVRGLQRSLMIGVLASLGATVIAAFVGTAVAYYEGWRETVGVWVLDMLLVIPAFLLLAIVTKSASGSSGWLVLALAIMFFQWVGYARILRSMALSLREREYVQAAKFMGVRSLTILRRHMIPNLGSILIIHTVLGIVAAIGLETGLSFLGFGVKPPDISLGALIANGAGSMLTSPWILVIPSIVLVLLLYVLTLIGDGLRDALDPTSASGGKA